MTNTTAVRTVKSVHNRLCDRNDSFDTLVSTMEDMNQFSQIEVEIVFEHLKAARKRIESTLSILNEHFSDDEKPVPYTVPKSDVEEAYSLMNGAHVSLKSAEEMIDGMADRNLPFPNNTVDDERVSDIVSDTRNRVTLVCDTLKDAIETMEGPSE